MWRARTIVTTALAVLAVNVPVAIAFDGRVAALAPTPPMGWSSWYHFGCGINEGLFERTAKVMVASGMAAAGYRYVNIDDCWMTHARDSSGALQANPSTFPSGIPALASFVHGLHLKLGIYLDAGTATCTGFPGSAGHFTTDANSIAAWGIDYVKVDYCRARPAPPQPIYHSIQQALAATHRSMTLNVCEWGYKSPWLWAPEIANTWRTTGDYYSYGAPAHYWNAILKVVDMNAALASYARPGAFNDPNQLLIGTGVLSTAEERSQFSLWSVMAAPLIAGGELSAASRATMQILTNREVIAVDQDAAGLQGSRIVSDSNHQVWVRLLHDGSQAVLVLNTSSQPAAYDLQISRVGVPGASNYLVRDLWQHRTWQTTGQLYMHVGPHDSRLFRIRR